MKAEELLAKLRSEYELLKVGNQLHVATAKTSSARVVGVGRKWIHLAGGSKVLAKDVIDWWRG